MTSWAALDRELAEWEAAHLKLPLWWRDDDAVAHTPELERLSGMAKGLGLPLSLAVIPATAQAGLADFVHGADHLTVLVHGWAHQNHAARPEKKAEFGAHRPLDQLTGDAKRGLAQIEQLFGPRMVPAFVPPWNRVTPALIEALPGLGYRMLSTFTPRQMAEPVPDLVQINTHIDPIDWKGTRSLIAEDRLLAQIIQLLRDRRDGRTDTTEPLGLLTHHLVHDPAIWSFCARIMDVLLAGPGQPWQPEKEIAR